MKPQLIQQQNIEFFVLSWLEKRKAGMHNHANKIFFELFFRNC